MYDIFFVFLTPLIFNKSVMIHVATGGDQPTTDPQVCEKYPETGGCRAPNLLPMLFSVPRVDDYRGGSSLLGLGDIVLPGLLMSLGRRIDLSSELLGRKDRRSPKYFPILCLCYAVGLGMANIAVVVMEMGQPALMYLVPTTVGGVFWVARRRGEVGDVFHGRGVLWEYGGEEGGGEDGGRKMSRDSDGLLADVDGLSAEVV